MTHDASAGLCPNFVTRVRTTAFHPVTIYASFVIVIQFFPALHENL